MVLFLRAVACALVFASSAPIFAETASAQSYPSHSVRMLVPFAAAGPTDVIARILAQKLSDNLGQQFYVENVPGGGGNTGTAQAAKSAPDGYTILVVSTGFIINPSLYAKVPYDPMRDFAPVTLVAASPNVLSVNPAVPAKSVKELVDLIKANPGKYSFAQPATGSNSASVWRTVQIDVRSRPRDGAFPGRGAGDHLDNRRPHSDRVHRLAARACQHPGRQAPGTGGVGREAGCWFA